MLENFFKLNNEPKIVTQQTEFLSICNENNEIKNIVYQPDDLKPLTHPRLKFNKKSFTNVSFSKSNLLNVDFLDCHFEDCLFIGTKIKDCNFQKCSFKNVNTHKIEITNTYLDPSSFINNIKEIKYSNISVHLFQQLLNNSKDLEQSKFARIAEYNFRKWKDNLVYNKYKNKKPYPINMGEFLINFIPSIFYRFTFGYGLRLRNFLITFLITMFTFLGINSILWKAYELEVKDAIIEYFSNQNVNFSTNFYYTIDATTKLIDSQIQPTSNLGMIFLTIQGIAGFILLSALITILINRFVK